MKKLVWILAIALLLVHQDCWFWDDRTLVFGFIPVGLFYHACFSVAAAAVWLLAVKFAWPSTVEDWAMDDQADDRAGVQS